MRLLVCLGQGLGNMVQATPCIRALSALGHEIDLYVDDTWGIGHQLFEGWPIIEKIFSRATSRESRAPSDEPRVTAYDMILRTIWGRWPEAVKERPGDFVLSEVSPSWTVNEVHQNMILAERLGFRGPAPWPHVEYDDVKPVAEVVIAPGYYKSEMWTRRAYPHWPMVIRELMDNRIEYVVLGHKSDRKPWWDNCRCIDGVSIREAAGIMKAAELVVGVDNGLCHIAAAVGTPVAVIFGATSPLKSKPWGERVEVVSVNLSCQPCAGPEHQARWEACTDWRCMNELEPQVVFDAAWRMLQEIKSNGKLLHT